MKKRRPYLMLLTLIVIGTMNFFRDFDFTHHIINLIGLTLVIYSLIPAKWQLLTMKK